MDRVLTDSDYVDRMMSLVGRLDATIRGLVWIMEALEPLRRRSKGIRTLYDTSEKAEGELALILYTIRLNYETSDHPNMGVQMIIDSLRTESLIRLLDRFPYDQFRCLEEAVRSATYGIATSTAAYVSARGKTHTIPAFSINGAYADFKIAVHETYSSKP